MSEFEETAVDDVEEAGRTGWPMALGIVAIVFGAIGALGGCANIAFMLFIEPFSATLADAAAQPVETFGLAGVLAWKGWVIASALVSVVIAVLLLVGGVALSRRRPSSRSVLVTWAIIKIVFVPANAVLAFMMNRTQFEAAQENPTTAGLSGEFSRLMGDGFVVIGALWGWALPVFLLIWFARRKIKDEIAIWNDDPRSGDALPR